MIKNIFLTGLPCIGKTSLIKEIIATLNTKIGGFFTSEIKENNKRIGFKIETFDGKSGLLAHVNIKSPCRVSKYKVNLEDLEKIGVSSILKAVTEQNIIVIDEIGKMELCSSRFRDALIKALESPNKIIGTIKPTDDIFTTRIKSRDDTVVFTLSKVNREEVKAKILNLLIADI